MVKLMDLNRKIKEAEEKMNNAEDEKEYYKYRNILTDLMAQRLTMIEEF